MISIIVPTYNRLGVLKKCLESVVSQEYPGLELIVIDDFSQDATKEYLTELAQQYPFLKVHFNARNYGVNYSRNRGIELASREYILFLDSDDQLVDGSLPKVLSNLVEHPNCKHFLFLVSDRAENIKNLTRPKEIYYKNWLKGEIYGDFTHVISSKIMKKYPFFEEFRMFEHLNWLRIQKETTPQLLIPIITAERDRNRTDSLTLSSRLQTMSVIRSKFEAEKIYYSMYHKDLKTYHPESFSSNLISAIALGVASNEIRGCKTLLGYANKWHIKLAGGALMMLPSKLVRFGIIYYSKIRHT